MIGFWKAEGLTSPTLLCMLSYLQDVIVGILALPVLRQTLGLTVEESEDPDVNPESRALLPLARSGPSPRLLYLRT
jgi:hypothetical protein